MIDGTSTLARRSVGVALVRRQVANVVRKRGQPLPGAGLMDLVYYDTFLLGCGNNVTRQ
jgi:hypothetical protein